jgi:hypothetical protein
MSKKNFIGGGFPGIRECTDEKNILTKEGIEFFDRDIDVYKDEYDTFSKITENDMIPALLIIEGDGDNYKSFLYTPERNYDELTEALDIIKKHRKNVGIL